MRRSTFLVALVSASHLLVLRPAGAGGIIDFGTNKWTLQQWQDNASTGGTIPPGTQGWMEAFGKDAAKNKDMTNLADMPPVGKVMATLQRTKDDQILKVGGIFVRNFALTQDANVTLTGSLDGMFKATGNFFGQDMINAQIRVIVRSQDGKTPYGSAIDALGLAASQEGKNMLKAGTFPEKDNKDATIDDLKKGDKYQLVFDFSSDLQLSKKAGATDSLQSLFFTTFSGNISATAVPEPSSLVLFGPAILLPIWALWTRKREASPGRT